MTKRVLSMLLALIMALSLCVPAFAADEPEVITEEPATEAADEPEVTALDEPEPVVDIQQPNQQALSDAVAAKESTINVGSDSLNWVDSTTIDWNLTLTIDSSVANFNQTPQNFAVGKGGTLTINATDKTTIGGTFKVDDGGTLVINCGKIAGTITNNNGNLTIAGGSITGAVTSAKGSVTVSGGTVNPGSGDAITISGGNLTVTAGVIGGTVTDGTWAAGSATTGIKIAAAAGTVLISGGDIGGTTSLDVDQGKRDNTISVTGGTFHTKVDGGSVPGFITGGKFIVSVEEASLSNEFNLQDTPASATVAYFDDGTDKYVIVGKTAVENATEALKSGTVTVEQGDADFEKLPAGVKVTKGEDAGTVTVDGKEVDDATGEGVVATIGSDSYGSLTAALAKAKAGDTIVLAADVKASGDGETALASGLTLDKNLTIDLNGHILDMETQNITIADAAVTFTGNGNIVGSTPGTITITAGEKKTAGVSFVNTYSQLAVESSSQPGKVSVSVDADSVVASIGAAAPLAGSVTVAGVVTGDVKVKGDATISGEVAKAVEIELVDNTASVTGEVGGNLTIKGDGKATVNATVTGTATLGESDDELDLTVSGGEYAAVTVDIEKHSDVAVSGGVFSGTVTLTSPANVISGGAYAPDNGANLAGAVYLAKGAVAAQVSDKQEEPDSYESPLEENYYYVGSDITAALGKITEGELNVVKGDLTLSSIGDKITVSTAADTSLKVGNVTVGEEATGVTGKQINELNSLIATAQKAQVSGQLTDEALQKLVNAYTEALKDQTEANIQDSIDNLKKSLEGYEEEEAPTAPTGGTGWVETESGEWYYFNKGEMVKNQWVESGRALWYYMNPDGTLAHGGFTYVPACRGINKDGKDAGTFAAGYFYLRHNNYNGCIGQARHGTVAIEASAVDGVAAKGTGVFETKHNGHYGACVSLNGKAVNYTDL